MKIIRLLVLFAALSFTGCTSNLILSDYKSEEDFYNELQKHSEYRKVDVKTDELSFVLEEMIVNKDSVSGKVISIEHENSSSFNYSREVLSRVSFPTNEVRSFSITKRTPAIPKGMGIGALIGGFLGGNFIQVGGSSNSGNHPEPFAGILMGALAGTLLGGITGFIVGDDLIFSELELSKDELFKENSVHKLGLKLGYHRGYNISSVAAEGHSLGGSDGEGTPGFSITIYYNYVLGKNISINNEASFISAGSEEVYTVPDFIGRGDEKIKVIEAAPLLRINLARNEFTPYFIVGPKFGYQFTGSESAKENFYNNVNTQQSSQGISVTGKYNNFFWSGVIGAGLSTGKLFPYEILIEVRYCKDLSSRFEVVYQNPNLMYPFPNYWENEHQAEEIIFNLGVALH